MSALLKTIDLYERFSRILKDAFDDCLTAMTQKHSTVLPSELAQINTVQTAGATIAALFNELSDRLQPFSLSTRFEESFSVFRQETDAVSWVQILLEHHRKIQSRKPPNGKAPWIEISTSGSYLVRTAYRRDTGGTHDDGYVHAYRTSPLWSFLLDLRRVKS